MLSEISQNEKDKQCIVLLTWNLKKKAYFTEWWLPRIEKREKWRDEGQRYKFSVIKRKSCDDLIYSMVTVVNTTTVLYT